ncbi:23S rRNA pseudouridine(1911/1915/1917) synthase RluD [Agarilytica rhodophyticola]|uniref:23S rRNA pseudouridine(1911/1915/1917) synthase RluD n=1 Tax=Agarilytica rhodophyticola TaxID=1737490 RepID=UPI000B343B15|nr:23S rRNA pseudouridine(1911/1915/1917) synthase RluD [Agarilytica rhodophyticola]
MTSQVSQVAIVSAQHSGSRFDQVAASLFPGFSRARIQSWIKSGELTIDGRKAKPKTKLAGNEHLVLEATLVPEGEWQAQDIPINVVYEDTSIIVVNKPSDLVVHPASGNWDGTLLNGLLFRFPELEAVPRAGIVHRLDKDTSGLMVVARTLEAQNALVSQLQARTVTREYRAIAMGICEPKGVVDKAIGRHPAHRTKMATVDSGGKPAITHFERLESFEGFSYLSLKLETGRTHQIRVHMAYLGHALLGDTVYNKGFTAQQLNKDQHLHYLSAFPRQALHAIKLGLIHPDTGLYCEWQSELPEDFSAILAYLNQHYR